jgi:hypothetical protein
MSGTELIRKEGWELVSKEEKGQTAYYVRTPYENELGLLKARHPAWLHLEIYAKHTSPEVRYQHMKKAHDILWPKEIWHEWTERRFKAHCGINAPTPAGYNYIVQAGGGSKAKSYDWGKIAVLFYFANPEERTVTVASTTLASLKGRVWGYLTEFVRTMTIKPRYNYTKSPNPAFLPVVTDPTKKKRRGDVEESTLHGMFAVTAKLGDDDQAIANWIGKHPKDKMLLILDEGNYMPMSIVNAFPNLNSHPEKFQLCIIANSKSVSDLHGCLATPKNGWDSVSIELDEWVTVYTNGICQYFNPYKCPAITHPDPLIREKLGKFLISEDNLKAKEAQYGVDSEDFYRMVLGFWKNRSTEMVTVSEKFLKERSPVLPMQWSGYYQIQRVAGFDFAISTDGDNAVLRLANVGHAIDGGVKIDFNGLSTIFKLKLSAIADKSYEKQIAEQLVTILTTYGVKINNLAVDVTGQGRAIAECIVYENKEKGYPLGIGYPLKVYSMSAHNKTKRKESAPDLLVVSTNDLYNDFRLYIENDSVRGLDEIVVRQLTNRHIIRNGDKVFLESKKDYKRRMSAIGNPHSPDEADASALIVQAVKVRLGIEPGLKWPFPQYEQAQAHLDKLYAMSRASVSEVAAAQNKMPAALPKTNFAAGVEKYAKFRR